MKRSKFSLSHNKLFSCDMGELIPAGVTEVLPGDTVQQATMALVRFSPLLAPVMHTTHAYISHWFVPHRLVWEDFEDFITGVSVGDLADYFGIPTGVNNIEVCALPFRAYALVWNEWYRDQDLETELTVDLTSGADSTTSTSLQNTSWEKDYFTSARPWEQKGASVNVPIGTSAPVQAATSSTGSADSLSILDSSGTLKKMDSGAADLHLGGAGIVGNELFVDLSSATGVNVNLLREAFALQRFKEARARFGSRYVEYLRYLGVRSSDARLQRPEFLGGGRYPIQFSEVLQTAEGANPVGELRGHGIGVARSNRFRRFIEEHGYILSFIVVKPKTIYVNGLNRLWNRRVKEDFFQRELQHIGQQEVLNKEVYAAHTTPDGVFGYQDRYDEYRRAESLVCGEFRSTLNFWHFARSFSSDPALNSTFVKCVPTENPFAVPSEDTLYVMARHSIQARRLLAATGKSYIY